MANKSKGKSDAPDGAPITLSRKFGWCIDGHDDDCRQQYQWGSTTVVCSCECHQPKQSKE